MAAAEETIETLPEMAGEIKTCRCGICPSCVARRREHNRRVTEATQPRNHSITPLPAGTTYRCHFKHCPDRAEFRCEYERIKSRWSGRQGYTKITEDRCRRHAEQFAKRNGLSLEETAERRAK